jgi:hypothetical protein
MPRFFVTPDLDLRKNPTYSTLMVRPFMALQKALRRTRHRVAELVRPVDIAAALGCHKQRLVGPSRI